MNVSTDSILTKGLWDEECFNVRVKRFLEVESFTKLREDLTVV